MMKPHVFSSRPRLTGRFEQREGAVDVRFHEILGPENGPVHMAFSGKMDNHSRLRMRSNTFLTFSKSQMSPCSKKYCLPPNRLIDIRKIHQVAGIGQFVVIDDPSLKIGFTQKVSDKIGSDKARSAGNQEVA